MRMGEGQACAGPPQNASVAAGFAFRVWVLGYGLGFRVQGLGIKI